ncbi:hypothetical protein, partial [Aeromonas hydrophila]|uniref:hypothetical protein n=1 Tax=Aeromonas hydrophila TaxID=644 RepID=UPI001C5B913D
ITTTGGVHIATMTGYRQQKPKIGLTKCPDLVDHYNWSHAVLPGSNLPDCRYVCRAPFDRYGISIDNLRKEFVIGRE